MLGAILGDIIGSRWEFNPTNDYNFELFSDKNSYTDDTICTIAVADALLHNSDDYGKYIHKWCRKYPHPMGGYGGNFAKWVASDHPEPYGSFGNGSAMRVAPIGWWFDTPSELYEHGYKSAACTHNHDEGILGAQAVAFAIQGCRELHNDKKGKEITEEDILLGGIEHGVMLYYEWPQKFNLDIKKCVNKFDETCQGTVPVALWIILHSKNFEDAIRQAVSLGADADTLGAITGSIAEALWGIPEWMKEKALSYLPDDMKAVVFGFHKRLNTMRKLSKQTKYYKFGEFNYVEEYHMEANDVEKLWVHDLARDFNNAKKAKEALKKRNAIVDWRGDYAEVYGLPLSLIGYIVDHVAHDIISTAECKHELEEFLNQHYQIVKKPTPAQENDIQQFFTMMFWKLACGNPNDTLFGKKDGKPKTIKVATAESWQTEPMPQNADDVSDCALAIPLSEGQMSILRQGHIPEQQEDHWFMYTDDEYIRYYRSWTGMCAFEAHYKKEKDSYIVDKLKMNHALAGFGVNGDESGIFLFRYLVTAETGGDVEGAWQDYLSAWKKIDDKYSKK